MIFLPDFIVDFNKFFDWMNKNISKMMAPMAVVNITFCSIFVNSLSSFISGKQLLHE